MTRKTIITLIALTTLGLVGCSSETIEPAYETSPNLPEYQQDTFDAYISDTQDWLLRNRVFMTENKQLEIQLNSPAEYQPVSPNGKAVLLVHGLGDSPYSFKDIATHLAEQGYLVRTVLLPGHGSRVGDLMQPSLEDWQGVVAHHTQLLEQEYDSVWLGGYSTGANLVTSQAMNDPKISGLLLFSPAFQPSSSAVQYAGLASYFITWADQDPEDNILRYNSLPMNGASVYYETSEVVREDLQDKHFDKPVFIMMSEGDSVIDTKFVQQAFSRSMPNPNNVLIWLGEATLEDPRAIQYSMKIPDQRISNGSHMGLLFSPNNPYYGVNGSKRICSNGQAEGYEEQCIDNSEVWYSAWGYIEDGKNHARLTYNPYFSDSMTKLDAVLNSEG
ncbi:alpha/beta hydrolase [Vibrio cyclitrophicus]|uniref:alpha/beta hydrolase n=1 Tax=Vibrio cyclitrophicus TaxID=47951 RepID=UPI0002DEE45B|nr:alpha/beta fold hydrolase [Vibrio cyclitrophicus]NOI34689.1 alpha/beta fold hydrolase [Vibrio cyclitrophicus]OBS92420.1 esterase [Vibrio cyclitrophicus]OCH40408.1 esterase [Vibrio cyclitrophicus]OEE85397.1 esterase [Vibrio cyclitrophicus FF160]OEF27889.1 esterase [Vibrio cyclitrophicus 1F97]